MNIVLVAVYPDQCSISVVAAKSGPSPQHKVSYWNDVYGKRFQLEFYFSVEKRQDDLDEHTDSLRSSARGCHWWGAGNLPNTLFVLGGVVVSDMLFPY